jgi:spectrin alpha
VKLKEANKQRTYIAAVKDLDFWLGEVESLLTSEDSGKDLASVQNLIKKHQLVEADIQAHDDRIKGIQQYINFSFNLYFESSELILLCVCAVAAQRE